MWHACLVSVVGEGPFIICLQLILPVGLIEVIVAQAGVPVAFASDWPVVGIDALLGMYTAVHRKAPHMPVSQGWSPAGAVTVEQALHAHTAAAAYACGLEDKVGSLK